MARPKGIPGYLHHKASGRAYVRINGIDIYLGFHNSKESKAEYDRLIREWLVINFRDHHLIGFYRGASNGELWSFPVSADGISAKVSTQVLVWIGVGIFPTVHELVGRIHELVGKIAKLGWR